MNVYRISESVSGETEIIRAKSLVLAMKKYFEKFVSVDELIGDWSFDLEITII